MVDLGAAIKPKGSGIGKFLEFDFGLGIGAVNVNGGDTFTNYELYGSIVGKFEIQIFGDHKIVPFARLGTTLNAVSNYQQTTLGYGNYDYNPYTQTLTYDRYYVSSGDIYVDLYGSASAGISYIFPKNRGGLSSEFGVWDSLTGDLKDTISSGTKYYWTTQAFVKLGNQFGLKAFYTYAAAPDFLGFQGLDAVSSTFGAAVTFGF